jgi:hypothetical protein
MTARGGGPTPTELWNMGPRAGVVAGVPTYALLEYLGTPSESRNAYSCTYGGTVTYHPRKRNATQHS